MCDFGHRFLKECVKYLGKVSEFFLYRYRCWELYNPKLLIAWHFKFLNIIVCKKFIKLPLKFKEISQSVEKV